MRYEVWLDDPRGNRLALLDSLVGMEVVQAVNDTGQVSITLPGDFDDSLLRLDGLVEVWRAPAGGALGCLGVYFLRRFIYEESGGLETIQVGGPDGTDLLRRRIVAYAAGTDEARKTGYADDLAKEIVAENLGASATDTDRDLSSLGLTVQGDLSAAPSIDKGMSWKGVLETLQEIADTSSGAGTRLYFDLVPTFGDDGLIGWDFQTFTGQRGQDRSQDGGSPVFFGLEWGNLEGAKLEYDYTAEESYIYAAGAGEGELRETVEDEDTAREGMSPWNRCEGFTDGRNDDTDSLTDRAAEALENGKPVLRFSGTLRDSEQARFGLDWGFGDLVEAQHAGRQFTVLVNTLRISLSADEGEVIEGKFEVIE